MLLSTGLVGKGKIQSSKHSSSMLAKGTFIPDVISEKGRKQEWLTA